MVNGSAKQQPGKRTETTATERSEILTAARLYSPSVAPSNSIRTQRKHPTTVVPERHEDGSSLNFFSSLGSAHRGGDAFPFRRQAGKIVGDSGEIAIDRSRMAARCVSRRIFQRRG